MKIMHLLFFLFKFIILFSIKKIISNEYNTLNAFIRENDILRAKENMKRYDWAKKYETQIIYSEAKKYVKLYTEEYIKNMISEITPASVTFCPNCATKGFNWEFKGQWSWDSNNPQKIKCKVCGMEFPNDEYKESIKKISNWNPKQVITFVDIPGQTFENKEGLKPSINGVIRGKKLIFILEHLQYLGYAYTLTKNITYANTLKRIFNRLSFVLPNYLVYSGLYSEYVDCDPKYVAKNLENLTYDKNKKCRLLKATYEKEKDDNPSKLIGGYFGVTRIGTTGSDGSFASHLAKVYDLIKETCTEEEKRNYEKNVLEEISYLGLCDKSINNLSTSNIKGVALVGLAINNIELIRFGLNQFIKAIDTWFLKDGGTSETAVYSLQTLGGLYELGYAFRNYSDPEDYNPKNGEIKYKNFDCISDTRYYECFQYLIWASCGNYYYPSIGDSYNTTIISKKNDGRFIEYINYANPIEKEFISERIDTYNPDALSFFFRNPNQENITDNFTHPDIVFPFLSQGFIRTGKYGEKSLIVLDASNNGTHHHLDSLNLYFWKDGHELLIDLGYLLGHKYYGNTTRTYVHNTVYVNDQDQTTPYSGSFSTFFNSSKIKIMQASSNAYKECDIYNRTIIQIEHSDNSNYFVDIFRVHGGTKRQFTFHGPNNNYKINSDLIFNQIDINEFIHFVFLLNIYDLGYIEIKDVILQEDGNPNNMVSDFPKNYPKNGCPNEGTWCHSKIWGESYVEVNSNSFKLITTKKRDDNSVGAGISIGNSDGYTGGNSFYKQLGKKFILKFKMRGNVPPTLKLRRWLYDKYDNMTYRRDQEKKINRIEEEYQDYSFEFILGGNNYEQEKKYGITNKAWDINWDIDDNYIFNIYFPSRKNQKVYFTEDFGQRDYTNKDFGAKLPYFYIDGSSDFNNYSTFIAVYEAHNKTIESIVKSVEIDDQLIGNIGIKIKTKDGDDYILSVTDNNQISSFDSKTDANVYVKINENNKIKKICLGGTVCDNIKLLQKEYSGFTKTFNNNKKDSYFEMETKLEKENIKGQNLQIIGNDTIMRTYPIFKIEKINNGLRIYTRLNTRGFRVYENVYWRIQNIEMIEEDETSKLLLYLIIFGSLLIFIIVSTTIIIICYRKYKNKKNKEIKIDDDLTKLTD